MNKFEELFKVSKGEIERGLELHNKSIVCDSLAFDPTPYTELMVQKMSGMLDDGKSYRKVGTELRNTHPREYIKDQKALEEYVESWTKSGVTCMNNSMKWYGGLLDAIESISRCNYKIDKWRDVLVKATCAEDIRSAKKEGKHALLLGFQSLSFIGGGDWRETAQRGIDNLDLIHGLGVRISQLTYNIRTLIGDGCFERNDAGLSHFGIRVVERMNDLGIIVDTGHSGPQTTLDAVEFSKVPIAASHTFCGSLYDYPRGKTDEVLQTIAEKDGYVGITGVFMGGTINDTLDHVDYAVNLIGADKVGIGTDVGYYSPKMSQLSDKEAEEGYATRADGFTRSLEHIETHRRTHYEKRVGSLAWTNWPYHTVGLVSRGYSDQEIRKIIGGNFLRLIERVLG